LRAVVDNNIWISALLTPAGPPARVYTAYQRGWFTLITSEPVLAELETVLGRAKFARRGITTERIAELLSLLRETAELVEIAGDVTVCRDPKDNMLIETALGGGAEVVVSRDEDLTRALEVADYLALRGIRIVTVRRFLAMLAEVERQDMGSDDNGTQPPA
jgi:putative PIN family toxin of toxin-antitoxin system